MPTLSSLPPANSLRIIAIWQYTKDPIDSNGYSIRISENGIVSMPQLIRSVSTGVWLDSVGTAEDVAWLNPVGSDPEEHAISYLMYVCDHRERTAALWDDSEYTYAGKLTPEVWEAIQDETFTTYATYEVPTKAISFYMAAEEHDEQVQILTERYRNCLLKALAERDLEEPLPPVLRSKLLKEDPFRV